MPIYEYKCPKCGKVVERVEQNPMTAIVPTCVHHTVGTDGETHYLMNRVQFSKPGEPKFVGPGFYATDYKEKP